MGWLRKGFVWLNTVSVCALAAMAIAGAVRWHGETFPGFLLLGNRVVASAGLAHWPATQRGDLFQLELVAMDGKPVADAGSVLASVRRLRPGTPVSYEFTDGRHTFERIIETRRFGAADLLLLFGPYLLTGIAFALLAFLVFLLRGSSDLSWGVWAFSHVAGLYALSAMDLYGPHRLFRVHVLAEGMLVPAGIHMALVFPQRASFVPPQSRLVLALYVAGAALTGAYQLALYDPRAYSCLHQTAVLGIGSVFAMMIATQIGTYLRPRSFEARQRVRVVAFAGAVAFAPIVAIGMASALTGGGVQQNFMAFTALVFPIAIGYAALRHDLLEVDAIIRNTVSHALLTVFIAGVYAGLLGTFEGVFESALGWDRRVFALGVGVVCVWLLLPLRDRVQSTVDRVFFRTAYDYRRMLARTSRRLASVASLETIRAELLDALSEAMHPSSLILAIDRGEGRGFHVVEDATQEIEVPIQARTSAELIELEGGSLVVPLRADDRTIATLHLGPSMSGRIYTGQDRQLLGTLASQAAIAVQNALAIEELAELNRDLERRVESRTRKLHETLAELRHTQAQLVHGQTMASIGRFVAGIAHELNNPLNFLMGNVHYLRDYSRALLQLLDAYEQVLPTLDADTREALEQRTVELDIAGLRVDLPSVIAGCLEGIERVIGLVRDLRTFSRIDYSDLVHADLNDALDSTLNLLRGRMRSIEVERDYGDLPPVECLASQLNQVFMNLLSNASDAVGEEGRVTIRTRCLSENRVSIEVEDAGCGIDPTILEHIFDPFFTTKDVGKGTGLGLSISYGIVARHHGSISVRSEPGVGTCFRVELPIRFERNLGEEADDTPRPAAGAKRAPTA